MLEPLKTAQWLTPLIVRMIAFFVLALTIIPILYLFATATGPYDINGRLLGTDYSAFWSAGRQALEGNAGDAYNLKKQDVYLDQAFSGPSTPLTAWLHPPVFYLIVTPFSLMPYLLSLACWVGCGFAAYLYMTRQLDQSLTALALALAYPAVWINVTHGQTGLYFAALFGGAMMCLSMRPRLAGVLIGLMVIKPQFGLLVPVALLAGGHYKTFASAAVTIAVMALFATIALGPAIWIDFLQATTISRGNILEGGAVGWAKFQSPFAIVRLWGGSVSLAYAVHGLIFAVVAMAVFWAWSNPIDRRLQYAALLTGSCIATPYVFDYDLAILAPALAWTAQYAIDRGFLSYEKICLVLIWLAPGNAREAADHYAIPVGLIAMLSLFGLILYRARCAARVSTNCIPLNALRADAPANQCKRSIQQ
ncbi:MAG: glycosyltransferase family 87 protein [Pseudomonadota bacterium]